MPETFSDRQGYRANDVEIIVREDAPDNLRYAIPQIAKGLGMSFTDIREIVCRILLVRPDPDNWSEIPNVRGEVNHLIGTCLWFKVYDIPEALYDETRYDLKETFAARLNGFLRENGIGWEMLEGQITYRGSDVFTATTRQAATVLEESNRLRASTEIQEALRDLSRRPVADLTGAVQHAMAAMESTARDVTGQPNRTLGQLVSALDLPAPLDAAVSKLWGYASDRARHVREGDTLDTTEAELLVSVAGALCTFLARLNFPRRNHSKIGLSSRKAGTIC